MSRRANPAWIGGFVLGALALMLAAVVTFGSGRFLTPTASFIVFFEGTVNGLQIGAPVSFRGVRIGEVTDIAALVVGDGADLQIEVEIELDGDPIRSTEGAIESTPESIRQSVAYMVKERNLRAKLRTASMVTGQLYVGLDFYPDTPGRLLGLDDRLPEIPTVPSSMSKLRSTFNEVMEQLREASIAEILEDVRATVAAIEQLVSSSALQEAIEGANRLLNNPDVAPTIEELRDTVAAARSVVDRIDRETVPLFEGIGDTVDSARGALAQIRETGEAVEQLTAGTPELQHRINRALDEITEAARALRVLAEYIERDPNALLLGKPAGENP